MAPGYPTAYPDVNATLEALLAGVRGLLGGRFVGLYLYGSLASGHFDPESSDIDFLVVTTEDPPKEIASKLAELHVHLSGDGSRWGNELDGDYIPVALLRRHDRSHSEYLHLGWGECLRVEGHGGEAVITRHLVRECGVTVAGPSPRTLIDAVSSEELQQAVRDLAREWWVPAVDDLARLDSPHDLIYTVLTMCRIRYTLTHGSVVPKPVAAAWAQQTVEARWQSLIARAAARQLDMGDLDATREFLRDMLARC